MKDRALGRGVSVVVCTYNRSALLRGCLESIATQTASPDGYEVIVVDNNSTDDTRAVALSFEGRLPGLRVVSETEQGLSSARNRGWREARGEYVGYLDDDAEASPDWLSHATRIATQLRPEAFGGPYYAFYQTPKPLWFKDEYGSHVQGDEPRALMETEFLDGGNMFILRDVLRSLDGFHSDLGMKGNEIAYGEETHFFKRLRATTANAVLYYHPELRISHLVRPEKFDWWIMARTRFASGVYSQKILEGSKRHALRGVALRIVKVNLEGIVHLTAGLLCRDRKKYPLYQNYVYERVMPLFSQIGQCYETIAVAMKKK